MWVASSRWGSGAAQGREMVLPRPWEGHLSIFNHDMFPAAAVAEVSGQLGKSLVKFCSGDVGPDGVLPDTQLLDPVLKETSTAPLAQPPGKGMDGESRWDPPAHAHPVPSSHPAQPLVPNTRVSLRSTVLHLHVWDHGAAQGCHHRAQQVRGPWVLPDPHPPTGEPLQVVSLRPDHPASAPHHCPRPSSF